MTLDVLQIGMEWFSELPGGLNRVYAHLLAEHAKLGVRTLGLVAGTPNVERESHGLARAFAPFTAPMLVRLRALRAASRPWLAEHQRDAVVVSHFAPHGFAVLDRLDARPFVVHFQGPWGDESRVEGGGWLSVTTKTVIERRVYRRADSLIVLSTAFADLLEQDFGVPRQRIHVIPGGVDADRFAAKQSRNEARALLGWPADRPIALCVRRLVRRVGLESLVDAADLLRQRVPDALVLIAGTGPLRQELASRIAARGLVDTVRLLGFIPDVQLPAAYRAANLSVVPSVALEGFGLITVESLAAGTPCVVTPVGGLSEIVTPLAPQLVTASPAPEHLADRLADALTGVIALPTSEQCAAFARANFDWPVIARRVLDVYQGAVA